MHALAWALDGRDNPKAAQWLREHAEEDSLWEHVGTVLDTFEDLAENDRVEAPGTPVSSAPDHIADIAFFAIAKQEHVERDGEHETWENALCWGLGVSVEFQAVRRVVLEAIRLDRAYRAAPQDPLRTLIDAGQASTTNPTTTQE